MAYVKRGRAVLPPKLGDVGLCGGFPVDATVVGLSIRVWLRPQFLGVHLSLTLLFHFGEGAPPLLQFDGSPWRVGVRVRVRVLVFQEFKVETVCRPWEIYGIERWRGISDAIRHLPGTGRRFFLWRFQ